MSLGHLCTFEESVWQVGEVCHVDPAKHIVVPVCSVYNTLYTIQIQIHTQIHVVPREDFNNM